MLLRCTKQSGSPHPRVGRAAARQSGFTLIELLIAVACVAILAAIAVASYDFAMVKARRGAAQACLTDAAQFMERWYTTNMTYAGAPGPTCENELGGHYMIAFSTPPDATSYTLQIVPQGHQASAETRCGTMTINQSGQKTAASTDCWK